VFSVRACPLPDGALLASYRRDGAFTDCYAVDMSGSISHARYVAAFYTTPVFKLERLVLKWAVSRPSSDAEAEQLAAGKIENFAAWRVENRCENQLLLADLRGRTRSWLMVARMETQNGAATRLYFGSAVIPEKKVGAGKPGLGPVFGSLLGFHRIYSQVLLQAAKSRLTAEGGGLNWPKT
jgi:hypothetical protein